MQVFRLMRLVGNWGELSHTGTRVAGKGASQRPRHKSQYVIAFGSVAISGYASSPCKVRDCFVPYNDMVGSFICAPLSHPLFSNFLCG